MKLPKFKKKKDLDAEVSTLEKETKDQKERTKDLDKKPYEETKIPFLKKFQDRIRRFKEAPKEEKNEKLPSFSEQMREQAAARRKQRKKKRLTSQEQRRHLDGYLSKAGFFDTNVEVLKQRVFRISLNITATIWVVPIIMAIINQRPLIEFIKWAIPFSLGVWIFVLFGIWIIIWGIIYFYLEMRIYYRTKELEEVLPDFLQLTSSNISAGMPIDRALWLAIRPNFGVLAKEIEDVAKATLSGEDLSDSLKQFVARYESTLLKRSISILLEGLEAGGELADLLNKIALNIQEIKIMKKEMAANVTTYAIFITFASIGIAPILFALATQLVAVILGITSGLDLSGASSSISITTTANPDLVGNFKMYSYGMLAVTGGMSAAIISVIRNGNVKDGIRNIPIFIGVALVLYTLASIFFGNLFGDFT